jgi:protein gp37
MPTKIEWSDHTWNPVTGCNKVSQGCKHCYAERMAIRMRGMKMPGYENGFALKLRPERLEEPLQLRKPSLIFVNSMSDLFHEAVPASYIQQVFDVMGKAYWHRFQVLTKRAQRLEELAPSLSWASNIWAGVSVENQETAWRIDHLRNVPAAVRFLSCEPLLGPIRLDLTGIHWVIVGGESGPGARPMRLEWARGIHLLCQAAGVPFFMKQLGGSRNKKNSLSDFPEDLRVRQMPGDL